jgi:hypothetical protein
MEWDKHTFRRTVPWDRRTNTGHMRSAPRTKHYRAFAAAHNQHQDCRRHEHVAYPTHVIPDDWKEASDERDQIPSTAGEENTPPPTTVSKENEENLADFFA